MTVTRTAALVAALAFTAPMFAALSVEHREWGSGPVKWIMTAEERKQWTRVATDDEAERFIQLFWARRDPTPGTRVNEFKNDFDARVKGADEQFSTSSLRGALTDRGRVMIVLGRPVRVHRQRIVPNPVTGSSDNRQHGIHEYWTYGKTPKRGWVNFAETNEGVCCTRDQLKDYFALHEAEAIQHAIVNPDLKEVPEWAKP